MIPFAAASATTPTDIDLVNLCAAIYQDGSAWDYLDQGRDDGVYWALKRLDGCDVVVFRGSRTDQDWWRDIRFFPIPTRIGTVHHGFFEGIEKMWSELRSMLTQPVKITGHSLGAARAGNLCGLMIADGMPPIRRVVFGEPKIGWPDFCQLVAQIPAGTYCNRDAYGHDEVTDVPFDFPHCLDFGRPTPLIDVTDPPSLIERVDPLFDYHHIQHYQAALAAFFQPHQEQLQ